MENIAGNFFQAKASTKTNLRKEKEEKDAQGGDPFHSPCNGKTSNCRIFSWHH